MKDVLALIEIKKQELEQLPLLKFMQDESLEPLQRLSFAPCLTPFAMNFGDLNKYVLRQEPTNSRVQEIINIHTYEDDHHWIWFLEDMKRLGLDRAIKFSDSMKFMWSDETHKTRLVCHKIGLLYTFNIDPLLRLAISESIEATGHVILFRTAQIAKELTKVTNQKYIYFGQEHYDLETGHMQGTDDIEQFITSLELPDEIREQAFTLVHQVFAIFTDMFEECMEYVKNHTLDQPFAKAKKVHQALHVA
ncbi:hypothetical protein H6G33_33580 [Calothrix sp. FACHB-1219]|uniref:hypothetical protein n=1 Tax=unclassified Calothrix TaxID=2619626 RepID=UPI0016821B73|nr:MULTISPECIES: hypothetical protein [unclassified Calothrix]MBD2204364.1 hypothetical protein [Calothrix sp. FACHB-168]MBD2221887.1 hypothetical protein [Calothrix sp. FACHB-1219]